LVTSGADSRIEVAAIMRSEGSPGKSLPSWVALTAIAGVRGRSSIFDRAKACSSHSNGSRSKLIRPLATKVATSRQLIGGTPIRVSAPIRRRAARLSLLGLLTDQIQA